MTTDTWHNAALALKLLALDPQGLGGAVIRMRASPDRDALLAGFTPALPIRKLPITIPDDQLFGGIDLTATLSSAQLIENKSFFNDPVIAQIPMAERCPPALAAKLAQAADQSLTQGFLLIDEGIEPDERAPDPLADRCAFHLAPEGRNPLVPAGTNSSVPAGTLVKTADAILQLTLLATRFGITSLRAPTLALRTARAHAQLMGRDHLTDTDLEIAATLVYPHRATLIPEDPEDRQSPPPPRESEDCPRGDTQENDAIPDADMLVDAVKSALPPDLLNGLVPAGTTRKSGGAGAGQKRTSNRRGRPLPSRPGRLDGTSRIDLISTLRAAAPWQPLRRQQQPDRRGLLIRPSDIRLKRYAEQSDRLLIFAVDASGSAAMSRLNEAKGAIELLLADAYASRDHVALIAFRGTEAETLLPPTRSLVQTKRRLSALPGGGGTPLASGLQHALLLAQQSKGKGLTPTVILITDGRANIALDGTANRAQAADDATAMATALRASKTAALVIDMSNRPQRALQDLSHALDAPYVALPRADAQRLSGAVTSALDG
ncbi:magnesium chelatase subunit D [Tateyamaria omphalii]|uniref:Magnesium chelatase ATPase subunit D n=1 Tax=Tateyamaria omphalii TaxID=299262 RepID=A0A1P8N1L0_9RHOB|nr:magnesium chelatase subunit D [Tateyamaria omphalii]APX14183.1 magnesium chelatase ATPase subunit D [Tateyamaria omphalii]